MIDLKAVSSLLLLLMLQLRPARAEENRYDVLAKVLNPLLAPFERESRNPNRSLDAQLSLIAMTDVPPQFIGTKIHLAVQNPDKIYLHGPLLGEQLTICRNEKEIWVYPRTKAEPLLRQLGGDSPPSKQKFKLGDLELPFSQSELILLPALFQVKEYAEEQFNGVSCRILEVNLLPEIGHSLGVGDWKARLWVGPDFRLGKLEILKSQGWHLVVGVEKLEFSKALPKSIWQPSPEEASDVMRLKAYQIKPLIDAISQSLEK